MFTPTLRCECAQPTSDRLMRKWCIGPGRIHSVSYVALVQGQGLEGCWSTRQFVKYHHASLHVCNMT